MRTLIGLAALLTATAGGFWVFAPPNIKPEFMVSEAELFCRACETSLLKRLKSPSSYKRLECSNYTEKEISKKQYAEWNGASYYEELEAPYRELYELGNSSLATSIIRYEAANSFGASIAGASVCEVIGSAGSMPSKNGSVFGPKIDGTSHIEWLAEGLKQ